LQTASPASVGWVAGVIDDADDAADDDDADAEVAAIVEVCPFPVPA
jgi:hypothetical protein